MFKALSPLGILAVAVTSSAQQGAPPVELGPVIELGIPGSQPLGIHGTCSQRDPILYHGGSILLGAVNAYFIWYGNWRENSTVRIAHDWLRNIGNSPYFNINTTYYDASDQYVSGAVAMAGVTFDHYSQGTNLTRPAIAQILMDTLSSGALPTDPYGVYLLMTSGDVSETDFCRSYCGWHSYLRYLGTTFKIAFIGSPVQCGGDCAWQREVSPNDNWEADAMVNVATHELEESITDPVLTAWYDSCARESADKCLWRFGDTFTLPNGSIANMRLGTRYFLIQQNWANVGDGYCAVSY